MKTLIIIPAYNEESNIRNVIENIRNTCPKYDHLVVNDASKDEMLQVLINEEYNYIDLPVNLGIGGAVQSGYMYAWEKGYEIAVQMDGDGQHDPKYLEGAIKIIEDDQADIVIGSRFIDKQGFQTSVMRRTGIKFLSALINLVCGVKVKDATSGYRIVNRKYISVYSKNYAQDYPEPEAIITAKMNGAKIKEIPVVMKERLEGESSISALDGVIYMIKVSLSIIFFRLTFKKRKENHGN